MSDAFADWDGAYVLGALSADDRRRYEEHLATCPDCARALQDLAGLPGILGELGDAEALAIRDQPDDARLREAAHRPDRTAATATRLRRRRRRMRALAAGLLALVLATGAVTGWAVATGVRSAAQLSAARELRPVGDSGLHAELSLTSVGWGTRLDWSCDYRGTAGATDEHYPTPVSYSLVVHTADGRAHTVATWTSEGGEAKNLVAATAIPADSISSVDIRVTGSGRALAETSV